MAASTTRAWSAEPAWKPAKYVEVVVGVPPGGPLDKTARLLQKIWQEKKLVEVPITVVNKPGGGHAITLTYLNQHPGDGRYVAMVLPNLLTNSITGANPITYTDVTPLALLTSEYIGLSVKVDSPVRTGKELLDRLRADPGSMTVAITSIASGNHMAVGTVMKAAGVEIRKMKFVSFKGASETTVAVLGGHVDILAATPTSAWPHVRDGKLRMLAVASPRRLSGNLAEVPTWKEQGADAVFANWRGVVGPKGMSATQVAFWDDALLKLTQSADWKKELEANEWEHDYLNSAETAGFMRAEYGRLNLLLQELGAVK